MLISNRWLREWVPTRMDVEKLATRLTMAGLEVGTIEDAAPKLAKVVVGEVTAVEAHPTADRLKICSVDIGKQRPLQIVCGAPNARTQMKSAVALIGARLPNGQRITKSRIRDVVSSGMLCSSAELALDDDADGILELDSTAKVGSLLSDHLQFDDVVLDIELTPNRGDCLSVAGVAREVAALTGVKLRQPVIHAPKPMSTRKFGVKLAAPERCPRFLGRVIEDVDVDAPTPDWMRERLRRSGVRSISALVDVTNYVMLELGQPLHAFDADKVRGGIVVRRAEAKEKLELLDGKDLLLDEDMLVIADHERSIALAGIMGGASTAVGSETRSILVETAHFVPSAIMGRARRIGLHTEASHRFERGVDPELPIQAQQRAAELYVQICGGKPGPIIEAKHKRYLKTPTPITLRLERLSRVAGMSYTPKQVDTALNGLGMKVKSNRDSWKVTAPTHRFDITAEHDLIEEVIRVDGYDSVPVNTPVAKASQQEHEERRRPLANLRLLMVCAGYQEAITYSFVDPDRQRLLVPDTTPIALANPIASNMSVMRLSMLPGLLEALQGNLYRQQRRVRLFEIGHVFRGTRKRPREQTMLGLVATGSRLPMQWSAEDDAVDFFDIKGDLENLLDSVDSAEGFRFVGSSNPCLHPGQGADIKLGNKTIGYLGLLNPRIGQELDITQPVFVGEIGVTEISGLRVPQFKETSRFPSTRRDLSVTAGVDEPVQPMLEAIQKSAGVNLQHLELFDVYRGEGIDSSRKSLTFGLTLQHSSRTLTDEEIDSIMSRVRGVLQQEHGAELRS